MFDIDNSRSYATEINLKAALTRLGFIGHRHIVVCNRTGRFTAIFPASNAGGQFMALYAQEGFLVLG